MSRVTYPCLYRTPQPIANHFLYLNFYPFRVSSTLVSSFFSKSRLSSFLSTTCVWTVSTSYSLSFFRLRPIAPKLPSINIRYIRPSDHRLNILVSSTFVFTTCLLYTRIHTPLVLSRNNYYKTVNVFKNGVTVMGRRKRQRSARNVGDNLQTGYGKNGNLLRTLKQRRIKKKKTPRAIYLASIT